MVGIQPRIVGLGALVLGIGVTVAGTRAPFPHGVHLEAAGECESCHRAGAAGALTVDRGACAGCHGEEAVWPEFAGGDDPLLSFPHARHVAAASCGDCHRLPQMRFTQKKGECDRCHQERGVEVSEAACAKCHGRTAARLKPPDHGELWRERHGEAANWRVFERHGKDCALCHGRGSCQSCHRESRPRSHTGLWRMRTHGAAAAWDRDRCRTCHETGTCVACHRTTPPLSHIGSWSISHGWKARSTTDSSCRVCHAAGECAACHAGR